MSDVCGEQHPTLTFTCDKDMHPFGAHMHRESVTMWDGLPLPVRIKKGTTRVLDVVHAIEESGLGARTGPPVSRPVSGPPTAAVTHWTQTQARWLQEAKEALHGVALTHAQFTNGDVWPLVDNPRERRVMVLVTRHGLRCDWMVEDHARREHGVWTTRDGVEFPLNKLIPVYRSLIFSSSGDQP